MNMARLKFNGRLVSNEYQGLPVNGVVTSYYGVVRPELSGGKGHSGVDIAGSGIEGQPILAPMNGVVNDRFTTEEPSGWRANVAGIFGNCVMLRHSTDDGELLGFTLYAHMGGEPQVERGDIVNEGDVLGVVGSKGLNDPFKFLDTGADDADTSDNQKAVDEQQQKANDLIDAGQDIMNDLLDTLQGKSDDMGG